MNVLSEAERREEGFDWAGVLMSFEVSKGTSYISFRSVEKRKNRNGREGLFRAFTSYEHT